MALPSAPTSHAPSPRTTGTGAGFVVVHLGARVPEDGEVARDKGIGHPPMIAPCGLVLKSRGEVIV